MTPALEKARRRAEARAIVAGLSSADRAAQASQLATTILASPEWHSARKLLLFVPLPDEIDLRPLIAVALAAGKRVALPSFNPDSGVYLAREIRDPEKDLVVGRFKIPEPREHCRVLPVSELDYVLVPGLMFDVAGGRLGRGKGFYDRLLQQTTGRKLGVGFREQLGPLVPTEPHDQRLDGVITAAGFRLSQQVI